MTSSLIGWLTPAVALGSGLVAGVFFAFSNFVMKALARVPPPEGTRAMQAINVTVLNRWFLGVFLGTAAGCLVLSALAAAAWDSAGSALRVGGAILYLLGVVGVTHAFNIPRNSALAQIVPEAADARERWSRYVSEWTAWNHVRTAAALVAAALLTAA